MPDDRAAFKLVSERAGSDSLTREKTTVSTNQTEADTIPTAATKRPAAGIANAVLALILVLGSLNTAKVALAMVNDGSVSGLTFLVSVVAIILFCVGALLSLLRGSRATVLFALAAIGFAYGAYYWYLPLMPAVVCAYGAVASVVAIVTPFLARS